MVPWSGFPTFGRFPHSHVGCRPSANDCTGWVLHNSGGAVHIHSDMTVPPLRSHSAYPVWSQALALYNVSELQGRQECRHLT